MKTYFKFNKQQLLYSLHWRALLLLFCLLSFAACQNRYDNTDWDADDDNYIGEREYNEGFESTNWYANWDANHDNVITNDEFDNGYYTIWDTDNDGYLSAEEYAVMMQHQNNDIGTYQDWDTNNDQQIDTNEYRIGADRTIFGAWDRNANGSLDKEEFTGGFFDTWDANDDNRLDENEYADWNNAYNR